MAPTVAEFFAGQKVLITGATGFLGKVLVEKLLRCCPNIDVMYLMVRPKAGQPPQQRVQEMIATKLYDKVREENPSGLERIIAVKSDMLEPGLGLSDEDREMLQQEVGVVFHVAATIKFDEKMKLSYKMNVKALQEMVKLCKDMKKLEAFVHTSTAYCNCDRQYIEEKIYPPPMDHRKLDDAIEWMDDEMLRLLTPKLIDRRPNTYTFTKAIAEHVLMEDCGDMPIAIVRPSIVGAAWKEPIPGWIDNFNGPSGIFIACGKGLLRSMRADPNAVADVVPVDIPVNVMIAAAWNIGVLKPKVVPVYNVTTGGHNPFRWGDMDVIPSIYKRFPLHGSFRRPGGSITDNQVVHEYWNIVCHKLPGYFYDFLLRLMGKKARMVRIYDKMRKAMSSLEYFTTNTWEWSSENTDSLCTLLSEEDNKVFYSDVRPLDWPSYLEAYCLGTKRFVLNEELSGLPQARAHLKKLRNIRYSFNAILFVVIWRFLIARSQIARNLWYFVTSLFVKFVRLTRLTSSTS
ncbi:fatty acyl-CoA reductase 1-like isoform X2 [Glandiceps talaboti]